MLKKLIRVFSIIADKDNSNNEELWQLLFGTDLGRLKNFNFLENLQPEKLIAEDIKSPAHEKVEDLKDNPNPKARIAFIIQHPFQYYIYKNIYKFLKKEAEFVIEANLLVDNFQGWFCLLKKLEQFLKKEGVYFRFHLISSKEETNSLFFEQYGVLVAHYAMGSIKLGCNRNKKKVRVMYGHSKDAYNFGPWTRFFDVALAYGPYSHKYLKMFTKSIIVGNPKFDDWFSGQVATEKIEGVVKKLDKNKKTILYLPTHGELSSLELVVKAIPELAKKYNLIVKPHHLTSYLSSETNHPSILNTMRSMGAVMVDDFADILPLLKISDIVLLDNSGAIFDAVLAEKPLVLLDFLSDEFFEKEQWRPKKQAPHSFIYPVTYKASIEQRIKREKGIRPGPVVKNIKNLSVVTQEALFNQKDYLQAQRQLKKILFAKCDGQSSERSAKIIKELADSKLISKKTFWAISDEMESVRGYTSNLEQINKLKSIISDYLNISTLDIGPDISLIRFSVVLPTFNRSKKLIGVLKSIVRNKGISQDSYEIIIVDDGSTDKTKEDVRRFMKIHQSSLIRYIKLNNNYGPPIARNIGVHFSRGDFVCFTDDDIVVPQDWFLTFEQSFRNNPEVAAVGGFRIPVSENQTIYAKFIYSQLFSWLSSERKSFLFFNTQAGDTASICYRKTILETLGGFNDFFRLPNSQCLEDWELKARAHFNYQFSFLFSPKLLVEHSGEPNSLRRFFRYYSIRGWGYFLLSRLYPDLRYYYHYTFGKIIIGIINDFRNIRYLREEKVFNKFKLRLLVILKNITIWFGKYWGAFQLISNQKSDVDTRPSENC